MAVFSRAISVEMDWVDDASFEIRGTLDDNVHSLRARFVVSFPGYVITEATGEITRMPYDGFCQGALGVLPLFINERVGRGFRKRAAEIVGGAASCNHLHTLITDMAACAFQMNYMAIKKRPDGEAAIKAVADDPARRRQMVIGWMPQLRNTCFTFSEAADPLFESAARDASAKENTEMGADDGKIL